MNQAEWEASEDVAAMLAGLSGTGTPLWHAVASVTPGGVPKVWGISDRKLRLWAVAMYQAASIPWQGRFPEKWLDGQSSACAANGWDDAPREEASLWAEGRQDREGDPPMALRAAMLRDLVGNPFRPVTLPEGPAVKCKRCKGRRYISRRISDDGVGRSTITEDCPDCGGKGELPAPCPWLTAQVISLATAADQERLPDGTLDNSRLRVLSDALEEVGCDSADLLAHLRSPGPHWRGMWSLNLVLSKE